MNNKFKLKYQIKQCGFDKKTNCKFYNYIFCGVFYNIMILLNFK